jgi:hypothetical protein
MYIYIFMYKHTPCVVRSFSGNNLVFVGLFSENDLTSFVRLFFKNDPTMYCQEFKESMHCKAAHTRTLVFLLAFVCVAAFSPTIKSISFFLSTHMHLMEEYRAG